MGICILQTKIHIQKLHNYLEIARIYSVSKILILINLLIINMI